MGPRGRKLPGGFRPKAAMAELSSKLKSGHLALFARRARLCLPTGGVAWARLTPCEVPAKTGEVPLSSIHNKLRPQRCVCCLELKPEPLSIWRLRRLDYCSRARQAAASICRTPIELAIQADGRIAVV